LTAGASGATAARTSSGRFGAEEGRVALTVFGERTARQVVLDRSDLKANPARTGGLITPPPDPNVATPCAGHRGAFSPSDPDIVVTGAAESDFTIAGVDDVDTFVQIVKTPTMARDAWQDWETPKFAACLRTGEQAPDVKVYSARRLTFPKMGSFTVAYRVVYGNPATPAFAGASDWILIAAQCARIRLLVATDADATWGVRRFEEDLARELVDKAS
jgi:hypothetical protein